ncbi:GlxA family transcriptional regulator [Rhodoblastus sp. 17X3]|uniref:GlxA family transcriptional regulator n=1 Tax=Rhodoblastus sp. 17X3 TaxID=3047026 RepID=UPI0024B76C3A|nr:GlxA family transcriptional regulator [Rhodoblastus sp. 17X3]MDI9847840.1 GlxA family transcriptional regulator [Rhodoblastus sp. 17X3]
MQRVGLIVYPGFQMLSLSTMTVFDVANRSLPQPRYEIVVVSEKGGLTPTSIGVPVLTAAIDRGEFDTALVSGNYELRSPSPAVLDFLRCAAGGLARRVAAPCTGAFVLAEAGLLDGRRATTHWAYARELQKRYPRIKVEQDRIFIADGNIWTSAGMTAGIDLALALVESDLGADVARLVAKKLVVYHRRAGGQSQHSLLLQLEPKSDRIQSVLTYARRNLNTGLGVEQLAEVAHLSPRQFSRAFHAETGQSPAKAVENMRVEAARMFIEDGRHSLDEVAELTGFGDRERMRRAFLRALGQPPQVLRRNARLANALAAE